MYVDIVIYSLATILWFLPENSYWAKFSSTVVRYHTGTRFFIS
jgi:hypothetical protein